MINSDEYKMLAIKTLLSGVWFCEMMYIECTCDGL